MSQPSDDTFDPGEGVPWGATLCEECGRELPRRAVECSEGGCCETFFCNEDCLVDHRRREHDEPQEVEG